MRNYIMIPLCFIAGIALAWGMVWGVNILVWVESITIGGLMGSLFWADSRGLLYVIHTFVVMFFYATVLPMAILPFKYVNGNTTRKVMVVAMAVTIIFLFDKNMGYYMGHNISSFLHFLHHKCYFHLLGGASFANLTWSEKVSNFEYVVFDIYVGISALAVLFNKRPWE